MSSSFLKDIASLLPGIFFILGYASAYLAALFERPVQPPVFDLVAKREMVSLGEIPQDRFNYEKDQGVQQVNSLVPVTGADGLPVVEKVQVPKGRGRPVILGEQFEEVTIPYLKGHSTNRVIGMSTQRYNMRGKEVFPSDDSEYTGNKRLMVLRYTPIIEQRPSGVFERRHLIEYRNRFDPLTFSVVGTFIGTVLGLLCILYERGKSLLKA